jgi:hypothetical protein
MARNGRGATVTGQGYQMQCLITNELILVGPQRRFLLALGPMPRRTLPQPASGVEGRAVEFFG